MKYCDDHEQGQHPEAVAIPAKVDPNIGTTPASSMTKGKERAMWANKNSLAAKALQRPEAFSFI
jgi:hypothetical protein